MREGTIRKTLTVCIAVMVAAASLPLARAVASAFDNGNGCDAARAITGSSGPAAVLSGLSRNPDLDFSELRLAGPLPGICGLGVAARLAASTQPAAVAAAGYAGQCDATLLALHCLLTV
jgi:hypothetical protein